MKRSRFARKKLIDVLKEHRGRLSAADLCWKHGIRDTTFYNCRSKFDVSETKRLQ
jgi:putative transposase